jgi:hypothetical protein
MSNTGDKQLKAAVIETVQAELKSSGFALHRSSESFRRRHQGTTDIFQLVCLNGKPGWRIQPNVGVRVDRVEEIFHKTSGFEERYQKGTPTIGSSVGNILANDNRACEFLLESYGDIASVTESIVHVFQDFALQYFEKFGSLNAIDAELNDAPTQRTRHRVVPLLRCSTGLIVAKLTGRPEYDQLVQIYNDVMRHSDRGYYLAQFESLVSSLESVQADSARAG